MKSIKCICLSILLSGMICGCDSTPSSEKIIPDFVKQVKADTKNTGVNAVNVEEMLMLNLQLDTTPENYGKILMLATSPEAQEVFMTHIAQNLCEGPVLTQLIKEDKPLALTVTVGDIELNVVLTPNEIKQCMKENKQ